MLPSKHRLGLALVFAALLSGCTSISPPTRFYQLHQPDAALDSDDGQTGLRIGLGPIELPEMLRRPQMVSRKSDSEMEISEFHRWAGQLEDMMTRALTLQLGQLPGGKPLAIVPHPWSTQRDIDYQLRINVLRFDGPLGGEFALQGMWILIDTQQRNELMTRAFDLREQAPDASHTAMAIAMGRLLTRLSGEVGATLRQLEPPSPR